MKILFSLISFIIIFITCFYSQSSSSYIIEKANKKTSAYWVWGNVVPVKASSAKHFYIYQGSFDRRRGHDIYNFEGLSPRPIANYSRKITLTYRLESLVPPAMVFSRFVAHRQAWSRHGIFVDGIQIDYDSPTGKLLKYSSWLSSLNNIVGNNVSVSITGLGDWLASAPTSHLKELSQQVSFVAFMMYHGSHPLKNIKNYTERLEKLSRPFKLGRLLSQSNMKTFEKVSKAQGYKGEIIFTHSRRQKNG
jgi:hypothetical protein